MSVILARPSNVSEALGVYQRSLTVRAAMTNDQNQISFYRRENRPMVVGVISLLLVEANEAMNVQRAPTSIQLSVMAEDVVETWWMLRLDEVAYAIRQGASGAYGTPYGKFDKQTLSTWLQTYDIEERAAQIEWANAQLKKKHEQEASDVDVQRGYERLRRTVEETGQNALSLVSEQRRKEREKQQWREPEFLRWQAEYLSSKQQQEQISEQP